MGSELFEVSTEKLRRVGLVVDYPIRTDTRRIIRIHGTLHGVTGFCGRE